MARSSATGSRADAIRAYVRVHYIAPARRRGERTITVVAGDVHGALGLRNCVPSVCSALRSRSLLSSDRLRIVRDEGPPSGMGTRVTITYEILPEDRDARTEAAGSVGQAGTPGTRMQTFRSLRGIARETFASLGGGESFLRAEREAFDAGERE